MLGLLGLVKKFQERLEVSRKEAIWRVIGLIAYLFCFLAALIFTITIEIKFTKDLGEWIIAVFLQICLLSIILFGMQSMQDRYVTEHHGFGNRIKVWF